MKTEISPYQLHYAGESHRASRRGALLKVLFPEFGAGYADCHPWPELGDLSLEEHLQTLIDGSPTALIEQSLKFARLDAEARQQKRHLFTGLVVPNSHYLVADPSVHFKPNLLPMLDFSLLATQNPLYKIKMGLDFDHELALLKSWRKHGFLKSAKCFLDFNGKISENQFCEFLHKADELLDGIEFFEDPFPYDPERWEKVRKEFGIALACDHESMEGLSHPNSCDFLVIKPATQEIDPFLSNQRGHRHLIITSLMDHPIGQLCAAYVAANTAKTYRESIKSCGLLSHHTYEATPFSARFGQEGMRLIPPLSGYGWGFNDLLEELPWKPLIS